MSRALPREVLNKNSKRENCLQKFDSGGGHGFDPGAEELRWRTRTVDGGESATGVVGGGGREGSGPSEKPLSKGKE